MWAASMGVRRPIASASGPETSGWIACPIVSTHVHKRAGFSARAHQHPKEERLRVGLTRGDGESDHGRRRVQLGLDLLEARHVDRVRGGDQDGVQRHRPQHLTVPDVTLSAGNAR